jgi:hypothetical protein
MRNDGDYDEQNNDIPKMIKISRCRIGGEDVKVDGCWHENLVRS